MISDIISQASLIDTDFKQYFISLGFIFSSSGIGIFSAVARLCNTAQAISRLLDVSNLVPIGCPRHAERLFRLPNARSIVALILACAVLYSFFFYLVETELVSKYFRQGSHFSLWDSQHGVPEYPGIIKKITYALRICGKIPLPATVSLSIIYHGFRIGIWVQSMHPMTTGIPVINWNFSTNIANFLALKIFCIHMPMLVWLLKYIRYLQTDDTDIPIQSAMSS